MISSAVVKGHRQKPYFQIRCLKTFQFSCKIPPWNLYPPLRFFSITSSLNPVCHVIIMDPIDEDDVGLLENTEPKPVFGVSDILTKIPDLSAFGTKITNKVKHEYHYILEEPKRLPFFMHPMFGRDRELSLNKDKTFLNYPIYLADHHNIPRKFYINLSLDNLAIGGVGGLMVGYGTKEYFKTHGRLAKLAAQNWTPFTKSGAGVGQEASTLGKVAAGSVITWRVAKRAALGAILYDMLKRNADNSRQKDDWLNAAFAGGVCGLLFGLRGGYQTSLLGGAGFAICAGAHHLMPKMGSVI